MSASVNIPVKRKGEVFHATVDAADAPSLLAYSWHLSSRGYATRGRIGMHSQILGAAKGQEVDHENGDKLDNRRSNIRICTRAQNNCNRRGWKSTGLPKGVYRTPTAGRWAVYIGHKRVIHYLGVYHSVEIANAASIAARILLHGPFYHKESA